ncbi:GntR family transcriptional regulator [Limnochorda pilosa]|uniref:GntR family transcriptional regulator n=1 Tax=Limnochorda pilosa TaxID=1555112 RepID=A0A0K2SHI5_LIMPI|nr:GntR family transcriptional regulator [Limnochorda pilosa]BAS26555.1 GntR family transcriptional regulator [Limnochorda pilosa]
MTSPGGRGRSAATPGSRRGEARLPEGTLLARGGAVPLHHQLRLALQRLIEEGVWKPNERLPGERALTQRFGLSRATVRQALQEMTAAGLLVKRHGSGTYVAPRRLEETLAVLKGFAEELVDQGLAPRVRVVRAGPVGAAPEVAKALGVPAGASVVEVSRIVQVEGVALLADDSFLPQAVGELVLMAGPGRSIYATLDLLGHPPAEGEQTIASAPADERDARRLGLRPGEPVLVARRVTRLADGTPVEYRRAVYRAERYQYRVRLHRAAAPEQGSA